MKLQDKRPDIVREWDFERNSKSIDDVSAGSNYMAFWMCENGHSYQATVNSRANGSNCPYCARQMVSYERSLAYLHPEIAANWEEKLNENLSPTMISPRSTQFAYFKCSQCGKVELSPIRMQVKRQGKCSACGDNIRYRRRII